MNSLDPSDGGKDCWNGWIALTVRVDEGFLERSGRAPQANGEHAVSAQGLARALLCYYFPQTNSTLRVAQLELQPCLEYITHFSPLPYVKAPDVQSHNSYTLRKWSEARERSENGTIDWEANETSGIKLTFQKLMISYLLNILTWFYNQQLFVTWTHKPVSKDEDTNKQEYFVSSKRCGRRTDKILSVFPYHHRSRGDDKTEEGSCTQPTRSVEPVLCSICQGHTF